jgi:hypothetical protein
MATLFPSCAETARRLSESQDHPLPFGTRVGVTLHLAACRFCRRYQRQLRFLRRAFQQLREEPTAALEDHRLSPQTRRKIVEQLNRETGLSSDH